MAEKKKRIFPKESSLTKRPVILKSDRDAATKETTKEKPEKEKQPTIILKAREQSAPKDDRPQSPKLQAAEESPQPSKIAQNESKEKKTIETKPLKLMQEPVKLLDENLEFNNAALEFLNDSSTYYLVVGVIGTQGVGKSMILNLLAQSTVAPDICQRILNSHEMDSVHTSADCDTNALDDQMEALNFSENRVDKKTDSCFKFKMQDIEQIQKGLHCTKGIDMYVTKERIILLDCQALWSPSLIDEACSSNPITNRSANVVTVDCLQIACFLMSVCHMLMPVQDWLADYNMLRYIQTAEMLKPSLSASTSSTIQEGSDSTNSGESHPHLLLIHNRCQLEDFTPEAVKTMQDLYRKAFQKSSLQLNSGMYLYSDSNRNGLNVDNVCKNYSVRNCGMPINLFLLPEIYEDHDRTEIYRGHPTFEQLVKRLRWMVLGVNRHQITNVPNLSEKGWFHFCSKAWETISKCTFFMEYERFLP